MLKQGRVQRVVLLQKAGSPFEIDRVPERDCRDNQVQPAGSMALVLEGAIADFAESVETGGPSHGVVCFALVEAGGHTASKCGISEPLQHKQDALDSANLAESGGQTVLTRIGAELAKDQGGCHRSLLDRSGQSNDIAELPFDEFDVDRPADSFVQWLRRVLRRDSAVHPRKQEALLVTPALKFSR